MRDRQLPGHSKCLFKKKIKPSVIIKISFPSASSVFTITKFEQTEGNKESRLKNKGQRETASVCSELDMQNWGASVLSRFWSPTAGGAHTK